MANRKRVQRNQPRTHQKAEKCISYYADDPDSAEFFKPKSKPSYMKVEANDYGVFIIKSKERALR
jgi:hypothetical protein